MRCHKAYFVEMEALFFMLDLFSLKTLYNVYKSSLDVQRNKQNNKRKIKKAQ